MTQIKALESENHRHGHQTAPQSMLTHSGAFCHCLGRGGNKIILQELPAGITLCYQKGGNEPWGLWHHPQCLEPEESLGALHCPGARGMLSACTAHSEVGGWEGR